MRISQSNWSSEDKNKLCSQNWKIGDDDDWYRNELYDGDTILDDWTCDSLIEAINKDIQEELTVMEILTKYLKEVDDN